MSNGGHGRRISYHQGIKSIEVGPMDWFFDGLGTLLIGLVLGGGGGAVAGWHLAIRSVRLKQVARDDVTQVQAGRDVRRSQE
jgi:hypothetical protein